MPLGKGIAVSSSGRGTRVSDEHVKEAIRTGCVSAEWQGDFPRYAWYMERDTLYEAVLSNRQSGDYHGYPLETRAEWPKGL